MPSPKKVVKKSATTPPSAGSAAARSRANTQDRELEQLNARLTVAQVLPNAPREKKDPSRIVTVVLQLLVRSPAERAAIEPSLEAKGPRGGGQKKTP